jgi:hypothetical protein
MPIKIVSGTRGNTPPYVSYPSFKTLLHDLHEHDVPSRIDRSVLKRFSGITGTQLLTALRFLKLIDENSEPTPRLRELAAAYGTADWNPAMIAILQAEYAPLFGLDLGNATASHFDETFRKAFPGADSVLQKTTAFFLSAAKDCGIIISDRVLLGRKSRVVPVGTARPPMQVRPRPVSKTTPAKPPVSSTPLDGIELDPLLTELLRRIPKNGEWPQDDRLRWFRVFAVNVSAVYDDPAKPIDLKITLAKSEPSSGHGG